MADSIHTLAIPSSTRYLKTVRQFVMLHALAANFSKKTADDFKLCVDEACSNVIKHAYEGQPGHEIDIAVIVDANRFTVRIRDRGTRFDRSKYRKPDVVKYTKERRRGGLGVHIMQQLMDRVEYQTVDSVNEIRLTKYRGRPRRKRGR